ncbi:hypothetical protein SERLADRAFT_373313 [Serpula lacrymans var. lacrymans S7.9]|nr:uncharacterized protein SERLADRAFT_373313 [Serpula lacrymans var. lacrymans S7.9]EGO20538.1 hypothetical protein SERLADRAFT_373313 [Serpula lacrymans var. lacrymans S7.9]
MSPKLGSVRSDTLSSPSGSSQKVQSPTEEGSAFYFTLQTGRDTIELRSFLSLDLAEHNMPPTHLGRKPSNASKFTTWSSASDALSPRAERPLRTFNSPPSPIPTLRRPSRESLRSIPSPKPAPSSILPDIPQILDRPPRLPSIPPSPPLSIFPSLHRSSSSAPAAINICSQVTSPSPPSPKASSSVRSGSISSRDRQRIRMDTLACLEGRSSAGDHIPRSRLRHNFMSMSADEDEDTENVVSPTFQINVEEFAAVAAVEEEEDVVIPPSPHKPLASRLLPAPRRTPAQPQSRKRGSTIESWFPLRSFIDLKEDDLPSWNWRSFIEIGGAS